MDNKNAYEYFYGIEPEKFKYVMVPKLLISEKCFRGLTDGAKILYALLFDRMSLSRKNGWYDENNRVYIIYTIQDIMQDMCCENGKACKCLADLEKHGLIQKKKRGQGKPTIIYVMNFSSAFKKEIEDAKSGKASLKPVKSMDSQKCGNRISRNAETTFQEVRKPHYKKCENHISRNAETALPEMRKSHGNNTDMNHTDNSHTDLSHTPSSPSMDETITTGALQEQVGGQKALTDAHTMDEKAAYEALVKENIWYEHYMESESFSRERKRFLDLIVQRIVRMATETPKYIMVKDQRVPGEVAKSVLLKLRSEHIMHCLEKIENGGAEIRNPGAYIDALLYSSYQEYEEKDAVDALKALGAIKKNPYWQLE